jgi:hypothetical protein
MRKLKVLNKNSCLDIALILLCKYRFQKWEGRMAIYGYGRVSTRDQTLASQDAQLQAAGCTKIYAEKVSGARSDRPELAAEFERELIIARTGRGPNTSKGPWREIRATGSSDAASTAGSHAEAC